MQANCLNSNQVMAGMVLSVPPYTPPEQVSQPTAKPTVKCGPPRNWVTITIQPGDTMTLRYRVFLHRGNEKDGKVAGMLSVNGYSGQVFLHTWHGAFVEESEIQ